MITLFSKTGCPGCDSLQKELAAKGILHRIVKIDEDAEARKTVLDAGFRSVPQLYDDVALTFITREQAGL